MLKILAQPTSLSAILHKCCSLKSGVSLSGSHLPIKRGTSGTDHLNHLVRLTRQPGGENELEYSSRSVSCQANGIFLKKEDCPVPAAECSLRGAEHKADDLFPLPGGLTHILVLWHYMRFVVMGNIVFFHFYAPVLGFYSLNFNFKLFFFRIRISFFLK